MKEPTFEEKYAKEVTSAVWWLRELLYKNAGLNFHIHGELNEFRFE